MDSNTKKLIDLLIDATKRELLDWNYTSSMNLYSVLLNSAVYSIACLDKQDVEIYKLWLDIDEEPICLVSSDEDPLSIVDLQTLYNLARNSADLRSKTLKASIEELQGMIDENSLPF